MHGLPDGRTAHDEVAVSASLVVGSQADDCIVLDETATFFGVCFVTVQASMGGFGYKVSFGAPSLGGA